jgi:hypothetical protein
MTYAVGQIVQASDYNQFVSTINTAWSTGSGSAGYGQPQFTNVAVGDLIQARPATPVQGNPNSNISPTWSTAPTAPEWRTFVNTINAMSKHQTGSDAVLANSFAASVDYPVSTTATAGLIAHSSTLNSALTAITGNQRLNAAAQGTTTTTVVTNSSGNWSDSATFTITVDFKTVNRIRYYFNAGGQIRFGMSHSGSAPLDNLFANIANEAGQIYLSSTNTTPLTLAGQSYGGVTKVGGVVSGRTTINNLGFYELTGTSTQIFKQTGSSPATNQTANSFISISAAHDGAGKLTFVVKWDEVPNGLKVSSGSIVNMSLLPPSTANIVNTWGTPEITSDVTLVQAPACATPTVGVVTPNVFQGFVEYNGSITVANATGAAIISGLPSGVSIASQGAEGTGYKFTLSGKPTQTLQIYDIRVTAQNEVVDCEPAYTPTPSVSAGTGTVAAPPLCATPTIGDLSNTTLQVGVEYSASLTITNAVIPVTISGVPSGVVATQTRNGTTVTINLSGTPVTAEAITMSVTASNTGAECTTSTASKDFSLSVTAAVSVTIIPDIYTVNEGGSVVFTYTINNFPNKTIFYRVEANDNQPEVTPADFTGTTNGTIITGPTATMTGTIPINIAADLATEPITERFRLKFYTNSGYTEFLQTSAFVTITDSSKAGCVAPSISDTLLSPGTAQAGVQYNGELIIKNATSASIISILPAGLTAGSSVLSGSSDRKIAISGIPTSSGTFEIRVFASNSGADCGTTSTPQVGLIGGSLTISAQSTPTITPNKTSVTEGETVVFSISTANTSVTNGTTVWWAAQGYGGASPEDASMPYPPMGSVIINNNVATISLTIATDSITPETGEAVSIRLYLTEADRNQFVNHIVESPQVTIIDVPPTNPCPTPEFVATNLPAGQVNSVYSGTIAYLNVTNALSVRFSPENSGLSAVIGGAGPGTITIGGTPTTTGTVTVNVSANNSGSGCTTSSANASYNISINAQGSCVAPTFSTLSSTSFKPGVEYSGTITVSNATSVTVSGLPSGLSSSASPSGAFNQIITISGKPTVSTRGQSFTITVNATNACGGGSITSTSSNTYDITVQQADTCPSPTFGALTDN